MGEPASKRHRSQPGTAAEDEREHVFHQQSSSESLLPSTSLFKHGTDIAASTEENTGGETEKLAKLARAAAARAEFGDWFFSDIIPTPNATIDTFSSAPTDVNMTTDTFALRTAVTGAEISTSSEQRQQQQQQSQQQSQRTPGFPVELQSHVGHEFRSVATQDIWCSSSAAEKCFAPGSLTFPAANGGCSQAAAAVLRPTVDIPVSTPTRQIDDPTAAETLAVTNAKHRVRYRRLVVVADGHSAVVESIVGVECRITTTCADSGERVAVVLRDDWYDCGRLVRPGAIVHVVPTIPDAALADASEFCCDASGRLWLILYPDTLISITNVGESFRCLRKAVLTQLSHVSGGPGTTVSLPAVIGDLMHDLFEQAVLGGIQRKPCRKSATSYIIDSQFSRPNLQLALQALLSVRLESLHAAGLTESTVIDHVAPLLPNIADWADRFYMRLFPGDRSAILRNNERSASARVAVSKVHSTEESIWSPMLGLKGKVDVIVQIRVQFRPALNATTSCPTYTYIVPLELKSGKQLNDTAVSTTHQAQVMLYGMLMSDYYEADVQYAILYYMKTNAMFLIDVAGRQPHTVTCNTADVSGGKVLHASTAAASVLRSLILRRNELASYADTSLQAPSTESLAVDNCSQAQEQRRRVLINLPEPVADTNVCRYCDHAMTCAMTIRSGEEINDVRAGIDPQGLLGGVYLSLTSKVSDEHVIFFQKWQQISHLEKLEQQRVRIPLWAESSLDRERGSGLCAAGLVLTEALYPHYTFVQIKRRKGGSAPKLLDLVSMQPGDFVLLSSECGRFGLGHARVVRVSTHAITCEIRGGEPLRAPPERLPDYLRQANAPPTLCVPSGQNFRGVVEIEDLMVPSRATSNSLAGTTVHFERHPVAIPACSSTGSRAGPPSLLWRIDKDSPEASFSLANTNITRLCSDGVYSRLRDLVVDLLLPNFHSKVPLAETIMLDSTGSALRDVYEALHEQTSSANAILETISFTQASKDQSQHNFISRLNEDQRRALATCLKAQDYALLQGMPGTGKTTTIAHLVFELCVRRRKRVLVTCNTHTAVDNVLEKLLSFGIPFLRIGEHPHISSGIQRHTLENYERSGHTLSEYAALLRDCRVFASTCMAVGRPIFSQLSIDVCIVDEAAQISLPVILGVLAVPCQVTAQQANFRLASAGTTPGVTTAVRASQEGSFVLVGDHCQLPPLVRSSAARDMGAAESLFERLFKAHGLSAGAILRTQFRMNADIVELSNAIIYDGQLQCGSDEVALKALEVPLFPDRLLKSCMRTGFQEVHEQWLKRAVDPAAKVVFADTSEDLECVEADKVVSAGGKRNPGEARLVHALASALCNCGVASDRIGVISPYRAQLRIIRHALAGGKNSELARIDAGTVGGIEVHTVDHFQGRDKDVIIFSLVRNNNNGRTGELLEDWRRMNVALTRAKCKLIVIGSRRTLSGVPTCAQLFSLCEDRGWSIVLPNEASVAFDPPAISTSIHAEPKSGNGGLVEHTAQHDHQQLLQEDAVGSPLPMSPSQFVLGSPLHRFRAAVARAEAKTLNWS